MLTSTRLAVAAAFAHLGVAAPFHPSVPRYQKISWGSCAETYPDTPFPSNLTCATFVVPRDWDHPGNETVSLGMVRLEATDKDNRIGNLFVNPGGPGGPATSLVSLLVKEPEVIDPEILAKFDIIGLDPRGVGISTPLQCDPAVYNERVKSFPKTEQEFDALVQHNKDLAASCIAKTGSLLRHIDTISAAKDHEAVRIALGGEKASFLGLSYGSQLFSQYASLYPHSFRAMILDGNLEHSQSEASNILTETLTYQATLRQFFKWCASDDGCALQGEDVEVVFTSVRDQAAATPIPAPGCDGTSCRVDVTDEDVLFGTQDFLTRESNWPGLAIALLEASAGNATILSQGNQLAVGDPYIDSGVFAGVGIACQDWAHVTTSLAGVTQKQTIGAVFAPLTRGASQSYRIQTGCIGWPGALVNPPAPVKYTGDVTLLQINSVYDPSTSYAWAVGLEAELGANTVLLTRNGSGHTSYILGGETTRIANAYLLNLEVPSPGTVVAT
ncbi:TAP-like protein-domain-containing protein [Xylariaceae sp. FL1272]|nr:TAP-like protein-domain-containing protein [Xylariaceae sp. FL1272]